MTRHIHIPQRFQLDDKVTLTNGVSKEIGAAMAPGLATPGAQGGAAANRRP